jgi:hypothetical protein
MQAQLGEDLDMALWAAADLLGVPLDTHPDWAKVPALQVFEQIAVLRLRNELMERHPRLSSRAALGMAAARLGVDEGTARMWVYRAKKAARST